MITSADSTTVILTPEQRAERDIQAYIDERADADHDVADRAAADRDDAIGLLTMLEQGESVWDVLVEAIRLDLGEELIEDLRDAVRAWDGDVEWLLYEEGNGYGSVMAATAKEALETARANVDRANYGDAEGTIWIDVSVICPEIGEEEGATVQLDEDEPECGDDGGAHDWQSPHEILGGCESNPGVQCHGGGVIIRAVCMRCGCERVTDTWAQRRDTGEQGLTSVSYEPAKWADEIPSHEERELSHIGCSELRRGAAYVLGAVRELLDVRYAPRVRTPPTRAREVEAYLRRVSSAVPGGTERRALRLALYLAADGTAQRGAAHDITALSELGVIHV